MKPTKNFTIPGLLTTLILLALISPALFASPNTLVTRWNDAALEAIRVTRPGPPIVARALAITHTCIYDAWAAYDARAKGTRFGSNLRRPAAERTRANKEKAVSYAAHDCLSACSPAKQRALIR